MKTPRLLATTALVAVTALGLTACGSDDDAAPTASTAGAATTDAGTDAAPSDAPVPPPSDDDDVTDTDLRQRLADVALAEVGEGRVSDVENSDDRSHAYEVDVELGNDDDVTVEIAEDLSVVRVDR